mgnify:CR=1 FL=1
MHQEKKTFLSLQPFFCQDFLLMWIFGNLINACLFLCICILLFLFIQSNGMKRKVFFPFFLYYLIQFSIFFSFNESIYRQIEQVKIGNFIYPSHLWKWKFSLTQFHSKKKESHTHDGKSVSLLLLLLCKEYRWWNKTVMFNCPFQINWSYRLCVCVCNLPLQRFFFCFCFFLLVRLLMMIMMMITRPKI